jgi:hypothetical protein
MKHVLILEVLVGNIHMKKIKLYIFFFISNHLK